MRDGRELWSISRGVIIQLKEWDGEELHILGHSEHLCTSTRLIRGWGWWKWKKHEGLRTLFRHLNYKELLALFWLRNVRWDKWILYKMGNTLAGAMQEWYEKERSERP